MAFWHQLVLGFLRQPNLRVLTTLEWVAWFNNQRLLESIGYIPPAEAEANYYRQHAGPVAMAA